MKTLYVFHRGMNGVPVEDVQHSKSEFLNHSLSRDIYNFNNAEELKTFKHTNYTSLVKSFVEEEIDPSKDIVVFESKNYPGLYLRFGLFTVTNSNSGNIFTSRQTQINRDIVDKQKHRLKGLFVMENCSLYGFFTMYYAGIKNADEKEIPFLIRNKFGEIAQTVSDALLTTELNDYLQSD